MRVAAYASDFHDGIKGFLSLREEAERRGWDLKVFREWDWGHLAAQNALEAAVEEVRSGRADALVVPNLSLLCSSLLSFGDLFRRSQLEGWSFIVLDLDLHTGTREGQRRAKDIMALAEYERRLIGARTRFGMMIRKRKGGRPSVVSPDLRRRIRRLRKTRSLTEVADYLNESGVPTLRGGKKWYPSTVNWVLNRYSRY